FRQAAFDLRIEAEAAPAGEREPLALECQGAPEVTGDGEIPARAQGEVRAGAEAVGQQHRAVRTPLAPETPQVGVRDVEGERMRVGGGRPGKRAALDVDASAAPASERPQSRARGGRRGYRGGRGRGRAGRLEMDVGSDEADAAGFRMAAA